MSFFLQKASRHAGTVWVPSPDVASILYGVGIKLEKACATYARKMTKVVLMYRL